MNQGPSTDERFRRIFDASEGEMASLGGGVVAGIYPTFKELRESGPVHPGSVAQHFGFAGAHSAVDVDEARQVFSCYSFDTCDRVYRDAETFSSSIFSGRFSALVGESILNMGGTEHKRYRALAQPSFTPRAMRWWVDQWINRTAAELISVFEGAGRADLTLELCARLPLLTIAGSFGMDHEAALDVRETISNMMFNPALSLEERLALRARFDAALVAIISERREKPADDLVTVLVQAELTDEDGRHVLTDDEILGFARLLLLAGSGTTWRQLGITLHALFTHPETLQRLRDDRGLMPLVIEEALRWETTDPYFPRLVTADVELEGVRIPAGSVVEAAIGAANRDPDRYNDPETFDIDRRRRPHLAFATGPHTCLGMHVARHEMSVAINALLDRLPNLRLDPDQPAPYITGLEHRGPSALNVVFG